MRRILVTVAVLAGLCALPLLANADAADGARSAYVGQQSRDIKALSDEDIAALRNADGMGLAKAAELNGYPGPRHVLALARELRLDENQTEQVSAIGDRMSAAARPLGAELIERERDLDRLFARNEVTPEGLAAATAAIGEIQGRLRAAHLAAHLETRAVLTPEQIARYQELRGYADAGAASAGGHTAGHHH
ncbi:MAG: Spy/CpxP family protein refolding chaperone [Alphaproteobacteria bacterium]|nr:Spy/CpxP family protein refolding chaperone [Alphaproteobacteria bacterium]MBV9152374.1 Spy/CpxP family protein refolding chaperone [Alphaproteobacteria bacterium]MBV9586549.1 Spy/CpxP family protein refolding chaperone [Alphaproteobacteria bacterium]